MKRLRLPTCFGSILLLLMSLPPLSAASKPIVGDIDPDSLKLLEELVAIPSGTASLEGQEQMRKRIIPEFEKLGFRTFLDEGSKGRKVLRFQTGEKPRVMLLGHTDTVFVAGKPAPVWNVSETSITGPGVIDMKGGIVLMIHLLHKIKAEQGSAALDSIMVVLNDDEETGSNGSKEILKTLARSVSSVLIFEPGLADGSLVSAHSGLDWIKIHVKGKAAHAGLEPEKGVNACVELAAKIIEIQKLNRYKERLSVSPDVIEGGTTPNTICEEASVRIDMRYPTIALRDKTRKSLTQITDKVWSRPGDHQAQFVSTILYEVSTQPMEQQFTRVLNQKAKDIARSLDLNLEARPVGYLSDGNHIAEGQLKLLVGVGPYGGGMHTQEETMDRRSFAERARWLQALLKSGVLN